MKRSQQKEKETETIYWTEIRGNFAKNPHELLVSLGSWVSGFAKWTQHTHSLSFSGSEESALPRVGRGGERGYLT